MRPTFILKNLPRREALGVLARRYPDFELSAQECFLALLGVAGAVMDDMEAQLARRGTSQGRFRVLLHLERAPGRVLAAGRLAEALGVTPATVTGLLDGLERDGQVRRERSVADRRGIRARLTPRGSRLLAELMPARFRRTSAIMAELSEPDRRTLVRLLDAVSAGLAQAAPV